MSPRLLAAFAVVTLVALVAVRSAPAGAQEVDAGYELQDWSPPELQPLRGGVFRFRWDRVEWSVEVGFAAWDTFGSTCSGLVPPGSVCGVVPMRASSEAIATSVGVAALRWSGPAGELGVVPAVGIAIVHLEVGTGSSRGADDSIRMIELGATLRYRTPGVLRDRVRLFVEARAGLGMTILSEACLDCYDPLGDEAKRRALLGGLTVGLD